MAGKKMCAGSSACLSEFDLLNHIRELDDFEASESNEHDVPKDVEMAGVEPSTSQASVENGVEEETPQVDDFVARIRAEVARQDEDEELLECDRILEEAKRSNEEFIRKTVSDAVQRVEASAGSRVRRLLAQSTPSTSSASVKEEQEQKDGKENIELPPSPSKSPSPSSSVRTDEYTRAMADLEMSDNDDEEDSAASGDDLFVPPNASAEEEEKICFACGKTFPAKDYQKHVQKAHLQKKELKCSLCNRKFGRAHHLKRHLKTHETPRFTCIHCNMGFANPGSLIIHKGRVHKVTSEDEPISFSSIHKCRRCLKLFKTEEELKRHDYYCKNASKIKEKRAEIRETKLACSPAMSTISYTSNASSPGTPTRPKQDHRCPVCSVQFASRQSMLRHVQRKHPDNLEEASNTRTYKTDGILAFPCSVCKKCFAKEDALATHYRRHFSSKTHECPHPGCVKSYAQRSELKKHAKRTHGIDV
ncbi:hypothetical protein QR680_007447 [Steinernema hermaphroditum]|uniref:C2H2-type domain-containing protein n=1 Tax=Steinernema hermaphroditum TaxID=289476 RepID=A0AA39IFP5_9BILA|nr:hypothetical protein QR680_007447 [Steinernema hermaphroditum]